MKKVFQEADITGAVESFVKYSYLVKNASDIPRVIKEAFYIASTGRKGPVLVDIPKDVQVAQCEFTANAQPVIPYPLAFAPEDKLMQAAKLINSCERPYIYFGGGVISGKASEEIMALADKIDAPIGCSLMGFRLCFSFHDHGLLKGLRDQHFVFLCHGLSPPFTALSRVPPARLAVSRFL